MRHLNDELLHLLATGDADEMERLRADAHLAECAECRAALERLQRPADRGRRPVEPWGAQPLPRVLLVPPRDPGPLARSFRLVRTVTVIAVLGLAAFVLGRLSARGAGDGPLTPRTVGAGTATTDSARAPIWPVTPDRATPAPSKTAPARTPVATAPARPARDTTRAAVAPKPAAAAATTPTPQRRAAVTRPLPPGSDADPSPTSPTETVQPRRREFALGGGEFIIAERRLYEGNLEARDTIVTLLPDGRREVRWRVGGMLYTVRGPVSADSLVRAAARLLP